MLLFTAACCCLCSLASNSGALVAMVQKKNRNRDGFTLLELMISVAIFAIILSIAVPNLLRSRLQSNEVATIQNLRSINSAQGAYNSAKKLYATTFEDLCNVALPYLPSTFLSQPMAGYTITLAGEEDLYTVVAEPSEWGVTGNRGFYTDASGIIRFAISEPADEGSPPL